MNPKSLGGIASSPITVTEFYHAFARLWTTFGDGNSRAPRRIGLAISGGSDSMALAYLCSHLTSKHSVPRFKAYIVDHKYRPESTQEALSVAESVKRLGIDSDVLTLQWPINKPLKKSGFETQARKLRYQLLGKACASDNIRALFLGHHEDDNVETALMRLAKGHRKHGLTGFDDIAPIPECHGLHGLDRSGGTTTIQDILNAKDGDLENSYQSYRSLKHITRSPHGTLQISTGGILIVRPFRTFPKSRLIATCEENKVPFVVDSTNEDHTFTTRNAVRKLIESGNLPTALQRPSLLSLVDRSREETHKIQEQCEALLKRVKIVNFDPRFGTLIVKLPFLLDYQSDKAQAIIASVMRSICDLVSPNPSRWGSIAQFVPPASKVFLGKALSSDPNTNINNFTIGGVKWEAVKFQDAKSTSTKTSPVLPFPGNLKSRKHGFEADKKTSNPRNEEHNLWFLSRQPLYGKKDAPVSKFSLEIPNHSASRTKHTISLHFENYQPSSQTGRRQFFRTEWTDWQLWDNRYWIRIRARTPLYHRSYSGPLQKSTSASNIKSLQKVSETEPLYAPNSRVPITVRPLKADGLIKMREALSSLTAAYQGPKSAQNATLEGSKSSTVGGNWVDWSKSSLQPHLFPRTLSNTSTNEGRPPPLGSMGLSKLLGILAPAKVRFTLPILTTGIPEYQQKLVNEGEKREKLEKENRAYFALPTIPVSAPIKMAVHTPVTDTESGESTTRSIPWSLEWEITYRGIDPDTVRSVTWERQ